MNEEEQARHMWVLIAAAANHDSTGLAELVEDLDIEAARDLACAMAVITNGALARMYGGPERVRAFARTILLNTNMPD